MLQSWSENQISFQIETLQRKEDTLRSPTGSAFAAAALAVLEATEAEDPLPVPSPLSPLVAVAVAASPLHTIDLGKIDVTDGGLEKEGRDTPETEDIDRGVYVSVGWDVNWGAVRR